MSHRIMVGVGVFILAILIWSSWVTVSSGYVGVVLRFGAAQDQHLEAGLHFKVPLVDSVQEIDIRLRKAENQASAASKDLQVVTTEVAVQYSLIGDVMPRIFQRIGRRAEIVEANVIDPGIQESVKAITAQYAAEELVTKRAEVKVKIQEDLGRFIATTLEQKGVPGAIELANVAITDFQFSEEFNQAIEDKVRAEQEALQAENEKLRRVTQAEAAAEERTLAADAEAYKLEVESKARAEAIRREAEALKDNPDLIELRIAEKWDGSLPQFTGGGAIPLLNVDSIAGR